MTKLFGFADIIAALLLVAYFYQVDIPRGLALSLGIYLMFKGIIFIMNFFSLADIAAGVLLVFSLTSAVPGPVLLGLAIFLGLKGLVSLFSFA